MNGGIHVTVSHTLGSTPREAGAKMYVTEDGFTGTVGGGALELRAIEHARELLSGAVNGPLELDFPLGPMLAQCCGGHVRLTFAKSPDQFLNPIEPLATVHLYGLGHVGTAVAQALAPLPFLLKCYDQRHDALYTGTSGAQSVQNDYHSDAAAADFHVVMTHSHALDLEITSRILLSGSFGFLGLIGSSTKRIRFERAMRAQSIEPDMIARLACPIGIEGIRGKSPEVIATSVAAQLLIAAETYALSMVRNKQLVTPPE